MLNSQTKGSGRAKVLCSMNDGYLHDKYWEVYWGAGCVPNLFRYICNCKVSNQNEGDCMDLRGMQSIPISSHLLHAYWMNFPTENLLNFFVKE
jgi:hypothetical protein